MNKDTLLSGDLDDSLLATKKVIGEERMSRRRHTLPHVSFASEEGGVKSSLGPRRPSQTGSSDSSHRPSIFDQVGEDEGLEALMFTSSSNGEVQRDMSMSPFSRIRNDLEAFVEASDRDIEARFLEVKQDNSPHLKISQNGNVPNSPLITNVVSNETELNVLWIGNLDSRTEEIHLRELFEQIGPIRSLKIFEDYASIKYGTPEEVSRAIEVFNGTIIGKSMVRFSSGKQDILSMDYGTMGLMGTSKSVWIGNLSPDADERTLSKLFSPFGGIESIRIVPSKRCAFVNFSRPDQATNAINELEGFRIGEDMIRLGYARQNSTSTIQMPYSNGNSRRSSTGSVPYSLGLNSSHVDHYLPPGEVISESNSLRSIFEDPQKYGGFQSAILTPAPKAPVILSTPSLTLPSVPSKTANSRVHDTNVGDWEIPELPPPYFGPELTPGRIRDYRRHVESLSCKPSEFDLIAMEILPVIVSAATDPVGNVLVQKLIERGSDELKGLIIAGLGPYLASIGIHKNGTWVVQKLINWCSLPDHVKS